MFKPKINKNKRNEKINNSTKYILYSYPVVNLSIILVFLGLYLTRYTLHLNGGYSLNGMLVHQIAH